MEEGRRGSEKKERKKEGKKGGRISRERLATVQSSVRRIALEKRRERERERRGRGDVFWRLRCGCSLDVPLTGTRLGDVRRQRSPSFFYLSGSAGFFLALRKAPGFGRDAAAHFCGASLYVTVSENNKCSNRKREKKRGWGDVPGKKIEEAQSGYCSLAPTRSEVDQCFFGTFLNEWCVVLFPPTPMSGRETGGSLADGYVQRQYWMVPCHVCLFFLFCVVLLGTARLETCHSGSRSPNSKW